MQANLSVAGEYHGRVPPPPPNTVIWETENGEILNTLSISVTYTVETICTQTLKESACTEMRPLFSSPRIDYEVKYASFHM